MMLIGEGVCETVLDLEQEEKRRMTKKELKVLIWWSLDTICCTRKAFRIVFIMKACKEYAYNVILGLDHT